MSLEIIFTECPHCHGYGVRDNGKNCKTCGGSGSGGLLGKGVIGSGEIMRDAKTRKIITPEEYANMLKEAEL